MYQKFDQCNWKFESQEVLNLTIASNKEQNTTHFLFESFCQATYFQKWK